MSLGLYPWSCLPGDGISRVDVYQNYATGISIMSTALVSETYGCQSIFVDLITSWSKLLRYQGIGQKLGGAVVFWRSEFTVSMHLRTHA
ncbi:hypothetical protein R1flu_004051 [Riccia fluitans]|uniref:Uncharacterized protein n=1 Tax=Riccia fluitans TaxID=41844 RepID=A0ABD1YT48_9MARC